MSEQESLLRYVQERLPAPNERERLEEIAKAAGVPYHTLLKIAKGETHDPRISTVENLIRYFREREAA
jgi:predicted transcriptional regulator